MRGDRRRQHARLAQLRRPVDYDLLVTIAVRDMVTEKLKAASQAIEMAVKSMSTYAEGFRKFADGMEEFLYQVHYNPATDHVIEGEYIEVIPEERRLQGVHFTDVIIDELPQ